MKSKVLGFAALSLAVSLPASALAQNGTLTRSFVSSAGVDSNPCTITQPCATFAQAYTKVGANGIVAALDPGKYGPLTISGPVTINGNGWAAITGPATSNAITINAGTSDSVALIGLEIDGAGAADNGIALNIGGSLTVQDCVIRRFSGDGILFQSSAPSQLSVSNTLVADNAGSGIIFQPGGASASVAVLSRIEASGNSVDGITVLGNTVAGGAANVAVYDSVARGNAGNGYRASADSLGNALLQVYHSVAAGNGTGLEADGTSGFAIIRVGASLVAANAMGWTQTGSGAVETYGDNEINGNTSNETAPTNVGRK